MKSNDSDHSECGFSEKTVTDFIASPLYEGANKNKTLKIYPSQGQGQDFPEPVSALAVRWQNDQIP